MMIQKKGDSTMNNLSRGIAIHSYRHVILHFLIALSLVFACPLFAKAEECSSSIGDYIAIPPFLSSGVEANLLLMLDNSGSMYDLAYVDEQGYCYDDTYITYTPSTTSTSGYAGYFDQGIWYYYNQTTEQFEPRTGDWASLSSSEWTTAGTGYDHDDVHIKVNLGTVTAFFAKGNFLNWATASKLDIQKKILTGGKYEETGMYGAPNGRLVMESRGCIGSRFVKQVAVIPHGGGNVHYLTLGVRPPQEKIFPPWTNGTPYQVGDIVTDLGDLYIATSNGISNGTGVADDTGANWSDYTLTRWTNGATYPTNSVVSDNGKMYITATGGKASGTGVANDTGITDWVSYNVTRIEIFPVTETGFANGYCELAIEEMGKESPNQGQLKQYIDGCMGYQSGGGQTKEADSNGAFNHSIHNCWYQAMNGIWPPGAGPTESVMNDCEKIYTDWGTDPWEITPYDQGYVCYGAWNNDPIHPIGYVGRCWEPGANATWQCIKWNPSIGKCQKMGWVGGIDPGWDAAGSGYTSVEACIEAALQDYCGYLKITEVIDPSDQASETGEFWNIPAVLIDSGLAAQLDEPIAVFKGYIEQTEPPTGIIQEFADDLRIGLMIFNDYGSKTECNDAVVDSHILSHCKDGNRDGGNVTVPIDDGAALTADGGNHTMGGTIQQS
jgi:type IV pilus assembly protein PilY1